MLKSRLKNDVNATKLQSASKSYLYFTRRIIVNLNFRFSVITKKCFLSTSPPKLWLHVLVCWWCHFMAQNKSWHGRKNWFTKMERCRRKWTHIRAYWGWRLVRWTRGHKQVVKKVLNEIYIRCYQEQIKIKVILSSFSINAGIWSKSSQTIDSSPWSPSSKNLWHKQPVFDHQRHVGWHILRDQACWRHNR